MAFEIWIKYENLTPSPHTKFCNKTHSYILKRYFFNLYAWWIYTRRAFGCGYILILNGNFLDVVKFTCDLVWRQQQITFIQITAKQFRYNSSCIHLIFSKILQTNMRKQQRNKTILACLNCCHKSYITLCNSFLRTRNEKQCGPIHAASYPFFVHRWLHQSTLWTSW